LHCDILTRQTEERLNEKKVKVEIQTWPKLKELIKLKDLIKFSIGLIDLIKDLIEVKIKFESQMGENWQN
jgi:hypothetical protein